MNEKKLYVACSIVEGFGEGRNASPVDLLNAWAYLIKTGYCWVLQGWYGRSARDLIESGTITPEGKINWQVAE